MPVSLARAVRGRHRPLASHRHRSAVAAVAGVLTLTGASVASTSTIANAATTTGPIVFGASGDVDELSRNIGAPLARHVYGQLDGQVKEGRFINVQPNVSWRTLASATNGSAPYNNLVRWANTLKGRPGPLLFSFSHEPEGKSAASQKLGTNTDFIAAWRKVHDVFVAQGVRNVEFTWTVTSNGFRVPQSDSRYAPKWYPGDAYVDNVATAAYNWYNCTEGSGQWLSLANRAQLPLAFAKAHGKPYVLAEWGSDEGPQRAQWLKDAHSWMLANKGFIRGAFYYQSSDPRGCRWFLNTKAEYQAFGAMAKDRTNFGG
jgi:hypothetical protein